MAKKRIRTISEQTRADFAAKQTVRYMAESITLLLAIVVICYGVARFF